jgi:O-antigen ligase
MDAYSITRVYFLGMAFVLSVINFPLEINGTSIITKIAPIIILWSIVFYSYISQRKIYLPENTTVFLLLIFVMLISVLINSGSWLFFINYSLLALGIIFFYGTFHASQRFLVTLSLFKTIVYFALLSSVLSIINFYFYDMSNSYFLMQPTPYYESEGQVGSFYPNPNLFGNMIAIASAVLVFLYKNRYFSLKKTLVFIAILGVGVYFSGSRMAIAVTLLVIIYFLCPRRIMDMFKPGVLSTMTLLALILASFSFLTLSSYIDLNHRDVIWSEVLELFQNQPLLGIGLANLQIELSNMNSQIELGQAANNFFLGFLAENGLIAFLLLIFFWYLAFKRRQDGRLNPFEIIFCFTLLSQFSESFYSYVGSFVIIQMATIVGGTKSAT